MPMNQRFEAFARSNGLDPGAQLQSLRDEEGIANMLPFLQWCTAKWNEFAELHPEWVPAKGEGRTLAECRAWFVAAYAAEFDAWLKETIK